MQLVEREEVMRAQLKCIFAVAWNGCKDTPDDALAAVMTRDVAHFGSLPEPQRLVGFL